MDQYLQEIEKAVQKAAIDGALTEQAVEQFHEMVERNESQRKQLSSLRDELGGLRAEKKELDAAFAKVSSSLSDYQTRERELVERERDNLRLQLNAEHQAARVKDHQDMFKTVFRNSVLRKGVMVPGAVAFDNYGTRHDAGPDHGTVEEEET